MIGARHEAAPGQPALFFRANHSRIMNVHTHPALAGFDDLQQRQQRQAATVMSAGDLAELTREEHRAKFKHSEWGDL